MKHIKQILIFASILFISTSSFSQNNIHDSELSLTEGTIDEQFEYVFLKSGDFTGTNGKMYEAVNRSMLNKLKAHTIDSLQTIKKELVSLNSTVKAQLKEIEGLKSSLSKTQSALDTTNAKKDSISLLGLQMSKTGYNFLLWIIITTLLAFLVLFIYKFKNSNEVTQTAKNNLAEIEEEFEAHRKKALEREQKVRRQLLDEINKQKKGK